MSPAPELLVIAEPKDELSVRLCAKARSHSVRTQQLDYRGAAAELSVRQDGLRPEVFPPCPIFLRAPAAPPAGASQLAAFHHAEIRGLVWAAGALTTAPVINRPTGEGFVGRFANAGPVLRSRAGLAAGTEVFVSHASALDDATAGTGWWFEHRGRHTRSPAAGVVSDHGPFRAGLIQQNHRPVVTCVAGVSVRTISDDDDAAPVVGASRDVAAAMQLQFATMVWGLTPDGRLELGRVNPYPMLSELGPHADAVLDALIAALRPC